MLNPLRFPLLREIAIGASLFIGGEALSQDKTDTKPGIEHSITVDSNKTIHSHGHVDNEKTKIKKELVAVSKEMKNLQKAGEEIPTELRRKAIVLQKKLYATYSKAEIKADFEKYLPKTDKKSHIETKFPFFYKKVKEVIEPRVSNPVSNQLGAKYGKYHKPGEDSNYDKDKSKLTEIETKRQLANFENYLTSVGDYDINHFASIIDDPQASEEEKHNAELAAHTLETNALEGISIVQRTLGLLRLEYDNFNNGQSNNKPSFGKAELNDLTNYLLKLNEGVKTFYDNSKLGIKNDYMFKYGYLDDLFRLNQIDMSENHAELFTDMQEQFENADHKQTASFVNTASSIVENHFNILVDEREFVEKQLEFLKNIDLANPPKLQTQQESNLQLAFALLQRDFKAYRSLEQGELSDLLLDFNKIISHLSHQRPFPDSLKERVGSQLEKIDEILSQSNTLNTNQKDKLVSFVNAMDTYLSKPALEQEKDFSGQAKQYWRIEYSRYHNALMKARIANELEGIKVKITTNPDVKQLNFLQVASGIGAGQLLSIPADNVVKLIDSYDSSENSESIKLVHDDLQSYYSAKANSMYDATVPLKHREFLGLKTLADVKARLERLENQILKKANPDDIRSLASAALSKKRLLRDSEINQQADDGRLDLVPASNSSFIFTDNNELGDYIKLSYDKTDSNGKTQRAYLDLPLVDLVSVQESAKASSFKWKDIRAQSKAIQDYSDKLDISTVEGLVGAGSFSAILSGHPIAAYTQDASANIISFLKLTNNTVK